MKLMLTKDFSPGFPKSLEPGKVNLMGMDFSSCAPDIGAYPNGVAIAEKIPDTIAELICSVQPMTKHPLESVKVEHGGLCPKPGPAKSSLAKIYVDGLWTSHEHTVAEHQITSIYDFEMIFEVLVEATRYFIETTMGLSIKEMNACATDSILAKHLEKQIVRTIKECVILAVACPIKTFDVDLLAEAVRLRACHKPGWKLPWEVFVSKLQGIVVKCDEENNTPEDVEQGKLNVEVAVPADHVQLDFVIGPEGADPAETTPQELGKGQKKPMKKFVEKLVKANPELLTNPEGFDGPIVDPDPEASAAFKSLTDWVTGEGNDNQPVPCDPPEPSKPLAVTKVPYTDEHGAKVAAPGPGWWVGDDFCWHPPVEKHVQDNWPKPPAGIIQAPYQPIYVTPGLSIGGHGTIGPGGKVEDLKFDGAWPVTGASPIAKSAPCAPTSIDDAASGFKAGDVWYNSSTGVLYRCASCTLGNAAWYVISKVTPTPEGPKIILSDNPKHLVGLCQQEIEGMKQMLDGHVDMTFDKDQLGKPVDVTYTNTSDQPDFQKLFSPEAEKDLVHALAEEMKKEVDAAVIDGCYASLGHVNKNGDVYGKSPILGHVAAAKAAMSDQEHMHAKMMEATKIPPHLLQGPVQNSG